MPPDILIIEPVWWGGELGVSDIAVCARQANDVVIVDGTLTGLKTPAARILARVQSDRYVCSRFTQV